MATSLATPSSTIVPPTASRCSDASRPDVVVLVGGTWYPFLDHNGFVAGRQIYFGADPSGQYSGAMVASHSLRVGTNWIVWVYADGLGLYQVQPDVTELEVGIVWPLPDYVAVTVTSRAGRTYVALNPAEFTGVPATSFAPSAPSRAPAVFPAVARTAPRSDLSANATGHRALVPRLTAAGTDHSAHAQYLPSSNAHSPTPHASGFATSSSAASTLAIAASANAADGHPRPTMRPGPATESDYFACLRYWGLERRAAGPRRSSAWMAQTCFCVLPWEKRTRGRISQDTGRKNRGAITPTELRLFFRDCSKCCNFKCYYCMGETGRECRSCSKRYANEGAADKRGYPVGPPDGGGDAGEEEARTLNGYAV